MKPLYATWVYSQINPHFGLVETAESEVFFVGKRERGNAFDGDTVKVKVAKRAAEGKKAEAEIVAIVKRTEKTLVGKFVKRAKSSFGFVQVVESYVGKDVFISDRDSLDAQSDDIVTVRIYGEKNKPYGVIREILGRAGDPGIEEKIVLFENGIEERFPKTVVMEAEGLNAIFAPLTRGEERSEGGLKMTSEATTNPSVPNTRDISPSQGSKSLVPPRLLGEGSGVRWKYPRKDLRHECIVTIDGVDARDLDDAISVKKLANGTFELAVHIADVAEYVTEWSALDREALRRGTSIYLPDRVIPMLPERLSNDLCSLHPHTPKATLSITMRLDQNWKVLERRIEETLTESKHRFTYDEVQEAINILSSPNPLPQGEGTKQQPPSPSGRGAGGEGSDIENSYSPEILALIRDALELKRILDVRRKKEGKIEFDFPEVKILTDADGVVTDIQKRTRNEAHHIIEEFMILANEEISRFFSTRKIPFLYRVHEAPSKESLLGLESLLRHFGYDISASELTPITIREIMDTLHEKEYRYSLSKHILTSMSKAVYGEEALGHFGLGLQYYSHFTSPIRRYPDLQIHRIIKAYLRKELDKKEIVRYARLLPRVGKATSTSERKAEDIEYKIRDIRIIEYMEKRIGKIYPGTISSLAEHGIYVELENGVEGLVYIRDMKSQYRLDEISGTLTSLSGGEVYRLGQRVTIRVAKTDKSLRRLDFELVANA